MRCVDADGTMMGIIDTSRARALATERGLDLVEISPKADPPVCRIMDFGKFRYEEGRKERLARKRQQSHAVKEVKFRPNVGEHDYQTKVNHLKDFLGKGHKVKLTLMFRGREHAHRELGFQLLERVIQDVDDISTVDMAPRMMGRSAVAMLSSRAAKP